MASVSVERLGTAADGSASAVRVRVSCAPPQRLSILLRLAAAALVACVLTPLLSRSAPLIPAAPAFVAIYAAAALLLATTSFASPNTPRAEEVTAVRGVGVQVSPGRGVLADVARLRVGEAPHRLAFRHVLWAVRADGRAEVLFGASRPRLALLLEARRALDAVLFPPGGVATA